MGRDKFLLELDGTPAYKYFYNLLKGIDIPGYVSCSEKQLRVIDPQVPRIVDEYNSFGPMGGLATAISRDDQSSWLVIACDLIRLTEKSLRQLMGASHEGFDAVTFVKPGSDYYETTLTIYHPGSFERIKRAINEKQYSLQKVLGECRVNALTPEHPLEIHNANTPDDLV